MNIYSAIEAIGKLAPEQLNYAAKAEQMLKKYDYERLVSAAEKGMRAASDLYMAYREALITLYELFPSLSQTLDISKVDTEAVGVSVDQADDFPFPVYKITLPFLLPNKRKNANDFKTAITETVRYSVMKYAYENGICPFSSATVIFLSYYNQNPMTIVDNDNKESSVILNALSGTLIRDDNCDGCNTLYYSCRVDKGRRTEIYIVDSIHDLELLTALKASIVEK